MDAYSSSYPSSSKSANLSEEAKNVQVGNNSFQSPHDSSLHSVRKSQAKLWKKAPVAPPAPTPVKVYQVDPLNFRDLVQQLTGAPEFKPQPHYNQLVQRAAPAPNATATSLDVVAAAASSTVSNNWYQCQYQYQLGVQTEALGVKSQENSTGGGAMMSSGLLELNLSSPSPSSSSYNWCSFPFL